MIVCCVPGVAHFMLLCVNQTQEKKVELIEPETEEAKVKNLLLHVEITETYTSLNLL